MTEEPRFDIENLADHPEFLDPLARWLHDEWGFLHPDRGLSGRTEELREAMNHDELPVTLVAHNEGTLLGSATLRENDLPIRRGPEPWLASVFVGPEFRGKGIATELIRCVEQKAVRRGFDTLYLFTFDREAFYLRRGWRTFERTMFRGEEIVVMRKGMEDISE